MRRVRSGEQGLILLTLGDPADPPHPAIVAAAQAALAAGRTHYSPLLGEPELRRAVAGRAGVAPENVAILPGAQHAGLAVLSLIAGQGDDVLLTDPHYATYPGVVAAAGARAVKVPTDPRRAANPDDMAKAITPATRALFLASPSNPTGAALAPEEIRALGDLAVRHDLWLVIDEVYATLRFDGRPFSALAHAPAARTVILDSLSKSHAMTGFRIGWAIGPPALVNALADWSAAATFGVSQFVQDAALAALALTDAELAAYRGGFEARARHLVQRITSIPGLSAAMPAGGMFVLADIRALMADDVAFAHALLDATGVAVVPGQGFGAGAAGHVRLSLTAPLERLDAACDRIETFCAEIARRMA